MKGKVKFFSKEKGYGFILAEDGNDYFFHYSQLDMEGFKLVDVNQKVEFDNSIHSEKGYKVDGLIKLIND